MPSTLSAALHATAGRAHGREDDLRGLVDAAEPGREAAAHLVPVVVGGRDDDADGVRLRHLRREDARQVRALLARRSLPVQKLCFLQGRKIFMY